MQLAAASHSRPGTCNLLADPFAAQALYEYVRSTRTLFVSPPTPNKLPCGESLVSQWGDPSVPRSGASTNTTSLPGWAGPVPPTPCGSSLLSSQPAPEMGRITLSSSLPCYDPVLSQRRRRRRRRGQRPGCHVGKQRFRSVSCTRQPRSNGRHGRTPQGGQHHMPDRA